MISQDGEPYILAMAPAVDPAVIGTQRFIELAVCAASEACRSIEELKIAGLRLAVLVGLPEYRPGVDEKLETAIADALTGSLGSVLEVGGVKTATKGHAAGLMAIESSVNLLGSGKAEFCLAGGVDSYIDPDTLDWVEDNEQLHKPDNAWGFIPGEAAAFCLLCTEATANRYRLPVGLRLISIATAIERNRIKTETVCIGEGLTEAVNTVLQQLPQDKPIEFTYCDQNGEAYRADEFGFMLARLSDRFLSTDAYAAPADCWGDVGAASGPLFVALHAAAVQKGYLGGELSLLWTSSEGGERSAAVISASSVGWEVN